MRGISGQGTFLRNDIHHTEDGIYLTGSNTLIQDNYIHDLQSNWSGPHYDGIATDGGVSNITIRHNTVINTHGQTSALMLSNYFGSVSNVVVDNNWLEGGGYTVYSDGQFGGGKISGVSFTNNYLVKGEYGYSSINNNSPVWEGNIQYTGQPVGGGGTPGAPTIGAISVDSGTAGDGITNDNTLTLNGTAAANSSVKVYDGGALLGTVPVNNSGAWSFNTAVLADGNHNFTATATSGSATSPASASRSVTVDTVKPGAPTITSFSSDTGTVGDRVTSDHTLTLTGTAAANSSIKVYDGETLLGTVPANGSGAWNFNTAVLANGSHSFTAKATDVAGNIGVASAALAVTVTPDAQGPSTPTSTLVGFPDAKSTGVPDGVTLTASGDVNVTKAGTIIDALDVKGTIWVMASNVTIQNSRITSTDWTGIWIKPGITGTVVKDNEILNVGSSKDGANGIFGSGTFLRNDIHDVENGINVSGSSLIQDNYIHDMHAPNVRAGTVWGGPHYDGIEINGGVSGVVIRHNTIINENGQTSAVMINNDFGAVSDIKVDGNYLAGGGYTLYSDGSFSSADKISSVEFTNNELGQGHWGYYYFKGNTPVLSNNDELGTEWPTPVSTGGTPTNPQPGTPTITTFSNDSGVAGDGITSDNALELKGTAAANSTVKIYDGANVIGTTTASPTGGWDYITSVLSNATHVLTATATGASGQTSAKSGVLTVTVDAAVPIAPMVSSNSIVNVNHVKLSGTAEANSTVTVYDNGSAVGTGKANPSGAWSITTDALSSGTHALKATAMDVAGNVSTASQAFNAVIPTGSTPAAPKIVSFSNDSGKVGDNITSDSTLKLNGTAAADSVVQLFDGTKLIGTASADHQGAWSYKTAALSDGTHSLSAKAVDASGQTGAASSALAIAIDTHKPGSPTMALYSLDGKPVGDATTVDDLLLRGSAEAGSAVSIFDNGKQIGTAAAMSNGTWSFDTGHLSDGSHSFTSKAIDAAGNASVASAAKKVNLYDAT